MQLDDLFNDLLYLFFLQNLTSDIGKILDLQDVENGLDDYRSTAYLTFEQYRYYLFKEVFTALPDEMSIDDQFKVSLFFTVYIIILSFFLKGFNISIFSMKPKWTKFVGSCANQIT